jgi:nitrite reductase/ring-hydroxylating ferredoxin subunit
MQRLNRLQLFVGVGSLLQLCVFLLSCQHTDSFTLVMMGARRGKGDLGRDPNSKQSMGSKNKGQEITGVTLPAVGGIRGWEFGEGVQMVCANVGGKYMAIQGNCPRCAFDLWKGDLIVDDPGFKDSELPIIACPTCATTYSMVTGKHGPPLKRTGLQAFTTGLAKSATNTDAYKDAKAFRITRDDEDGRVFCKER